MKNIILLNGPSLGQAKPEINFESDRIFAINRKNKIEQKIQGNVNFWCILPPTEFEDMIEEVYSYLSRPEENCLLTSLFALSAVRQYLEVRPLPNPHRVMLCDGVGKKMGEITMKSDLSIKKTDHQQWNSLAMLLYLIALVDKDTPTFIYGMDGVENPDAKNIYFNQEELFAKRVEAKTIYNDMIFFDKHFWSMIKFQGLNPQIFNMNQESFYKSIPFASSTFEAYSKISKFFLYNQWTNKEFIQLLEINFSTQLQKEILMDLKKPNFIKKFLNKLRRKYLKIRQFI